jgi:hypothetical protein
MSTQEAPHEIIARLADGLLHASDAEVLSVLAALPPLADESDPCWDDQAYWIDVAYRYVALADVAARRRLRAAIRPLLDRACYGDPGEIMRGLRHQLEAIVNPDWAALADVCLEAARSNRLGTRLWAIDQLAVLDDPRARPVFEEALRSESEEIQQSARIGLRRLGAG